MLLVGNEVHMHVMMEHLSILFVDSYFEICFWFPALSMLWLDITISESNVLDISSLSSCWAFSHIGCTAHLLERGHRLGSKVHWLRDMGPSMASSICSRVILSAGWVKASPPPVPRWVVSNPAAAAWEAILAMMGFVTSWRWAISLTSTHWLSDLHAKSTIILTA